jgi:transposase
MRVIEGMSNVLKVIDQYSIQKLAAQGWSLRRIARELGLNRRTVRRYIEAGPKCTAPHAVVTSGSNAVEPSPHRAGEAKCTTSDDHVTTGSMVESDEANQATHGSATDSPPTGLVDHQAQLSLGATALEQTGKTLLRRQDSRSRCESLRGVIQPLATAGLTARRIHQDLVQDHGFTGSYQSVKRFVSALRASTPERIYRIEVQPGEEMQVDFGLGAPVLSADGKTRRTWVFRAVLSFSRRGYSEVVFHQDTESFLRAIENAFRHFGGVPLILNLDNLKAAVLKAHWYDPALNPKIVAFGQHYGISILPCRPRTPEHKGKVERGVAYVKCNALKARKFSSLSEQNTFLRHWEETIADTRIHGTTKQQVKALFEVEKPHLRPLPPGIFPCYREERRRVGRDSYVQVKQAYYQVPMEYIGHDVWVRVDSLSVRVFNQKQELIASHVPGAPGSYMAPMGVGGFDLKGGGAMTAARGWIVRAAQLGPHAGLWAEGAWRERGLEAVRSLMGLCGLTSRHSREAIERACATALSRPTYSYRDLIDLLKEGPAALQQTQLDLKETAPKESNHPLIRPLSVYHLFATQR